MISFEILNVESIASLSLKLGRALGDEDMTGGILESFLEIAEDGAEVAVTAAHGCMLVRIYDGGRYSFVYPIEISEDTDLDSALLDLAAYSVKELIPFYLTDTPREELDRLHRLFLHLDARAYDEDEDSFVALIYSECDLLDEVPAISHNGITLSKITVPDLSRYAELCRSELVNRYWGYDYKEDAADADAAYFLRVCESELARGVAVTLAVREGDENSPILGEAVIFDFDYRGGAKLAVRLLPDFWGRGVGSRAFGALVELAREIGLKNAYAEVMLENVASIAMTSKHLGRIGESDGKALFELALR